MDRPEAAGRAAGHQCRGTGDDRTRRNVVRLSDRSNTAGRRARRRRGTGRDDDEGSRRTGRGAVRLSGGSRASGRRRRGTAPTGGRAGRGTEPRGGDPRASPESVACGSARRPTNPARSRPRSTAQTPGARRGACGGRAVGRAARGDGGAAGRGRGAVPGDRDQRRHRSVAPRHPPGCLADRAAGRGGVRRRGRPVDRPGGDRRARCRRRAAAAVAASRCSAAAVRAGVAGRRGRVGPDRRRPRRFGARRR